jgi:hypothetical protein
LTPDRPRVGGENGEPGFPDGWRRGTEGSESENRNLIEVSCIKIGGTIKRVRKTGIIPSNKKIEENSDKVGDHSDKVRDHSVGVKNDSVGVKNDSVGVGEHSDKVGDHSVGVKNDSVGVGDHSVGVGGYPKIIDTKEKFMEIVNNGYIHRKKEERATGRYSMEGIKIEEPIPVGIFHTFGVAYDILGTSYRPKECNLALGKIKVN